MPTQFLDVSHLRAHPGASFGVCQLFLGHQLDSNLRGKEKKPSVTSAARMPIGHARKAKELELHAPLVS